MKENYRATNELLNEVVKLKKCGSYPYIDFTVGHETVELI